MHRSPDQAEALERAGWLNELAEAISQAQKLAWRLGVVEGDFDEARDLYARLEAVRARSNRYGSAIGSRSGRKSIRSGWKIYSTAPISCRALQRMVQTPCGSSPPPAKSSRNGPIGGAFQPAVATKARLRKARLP